jgi:hypothetical protein
MRGLGMTEQRLFPQARRAAAIVNLAALAHPRSQVAVIKLPPSVLHDEVARQDELVLNPSRVLRSAGHVSTLALVTDSGLPVQRRPVDVSLITCSCQVLDSLFDQCYTLERVNDQGVMRSRARGDRVAQRVGRAGATCVACASYPARSGTRINRGRTTRASWIDGRSPSFTTSRPSKTWPRY